MPFFVYTVPSVSYIPTADWKEGQRKGFSVHFWGFLGKNERKMLRFLINVLNIFHLIYLKLSLTILKKRRGKERIRSFLPPLLFLCFAARSPLIRRSWLRFFRDSSLPGRLPKNALGDGIGNKGDEDEVFLSRVQETMGAAISAEGHVACFDGEFFVFVRILAAALNQIIRFHCCRHADE